MPGYKEYEVRFEVKPKEYTRLFIELEKEDPPTTTIPPTKTPELTPDNIVTHHNHMSNFNEENPWAGIEMGDQSHSSVESINVTYVTQSGTSYQETREQQNDSEMFEEPPAAKPVSNRSWLSRLIKSIGVSVRADWSLLTLVTGILTSFIQ